MDLDAVAALHRENKALGEQPVDPAHAPDEALDVAVALHRQHKGMELAERLTPVACRLTLAEARDARRKRAAASLERAVQSRQQRPIAIRAVRREQQIIETATGSVMLDADATPAQIAAALTPPASVNADVLSVALPGSAAGRAELFSAAGDRIDLGIPGADGLMWYPMIREGQWAMRPGTQGQKKSKPLKVIAGHSSDQRKEIGLADLKAAFDDGAVQHVTVPASHGNTVLENQGFIRGMKLVTGSVKGQTVAVLLGGYDITEPDTKAKIQRGTIANRSVGILYDYVNKETGKKYPAVIEHVALTNQPWITGMLEFGRKLEEAHDLSTVSLSLADALHLGDEA